MADFPEFTVFRDQEDARWWGWSCTCGGEGRDYATSPSAERSARRHGAQNHGDWWDIGDECAEKHCGRQPTLGMTIQYSEALRIEVYLCEEHFDALDRVMGEVTTRG